MIARSVTLGLVVLSLASATRAADAPEAKPPTCAALLKDSQNAKALTEVKLAEEYERSDAQVYLMRLELSVTKRELAATLDKCGVLCTPAKP